jgi:SSS family solute:Na+ symporter
MLDMVLTPAQLTGLLAAVLGIALLAVFTGTRRKSASASNGTAIVAGIIMGTLVGGSSTVGTAQLAYHYGMSAWWFTLGGGLACLVLALGFIGPWRRSGSQTLIGILAMEFGPGAGLAASLLSSVGTFINVISQLIAGTAVIAVAAPSLGLVPALLITAAFMALYVVFGGTHGAGVVGILKLGLLYLSMIGCGVMVLVLSGGVSGFLQTVNGIDNPAAIRFGSLFARGIGKDGGAALSLILGVLTTQTYAQAVLSAKSDAAARRGTLISAVLIPPIGTGGILVGLFMRAHHPGIAAKTALTAFATGYLPPVLSGIMLGTLFIAVVGTGAGLVMGISTIIRRDILARFFDKAAEDKAGSLMGKGIIILTLLLGVILSSGSLGDTILNFAFMSMGLRGAVVFVPMLCALWAPGKVNRKCAMGAIIAGPVVVLLCGTLFTLPGGIDPLFAGVTAALIFCAAGRILGNRVEHIRILHGGSGAAVPVIALDTELYSGGEALGAALSSRLGIPCYGEEILTKAAELSGIPEGILRRYDGRSIVAAYDLTADDPAALHLPTTGSLISAQLAACKALAEKGPCILVDRFASHALSGESIPVYLSADFDQRAAELARQKNLGPAAARRQLKRQDRARSRYYRNGNRNWGYAKAYAVSVNATGADPEELAVSLTAFLVPDAQKAQRKTAS